MSPLPAGCCNAEPDVCVSQPLTSDANTKQYKVGKVLGSLVGCNLKAFYGDEKCKKFATVVKIKNNTVVFCTYIQQFTVRLLCANM